MIDIHAVNFGSTTAGPGKRTEIFTQGCNHNCPGCFSPETHAMDSGTLMSIDDILDMLEVPFEQGDDPLLSVCGGEPLLHAKQLIKLFERYRKRHWGKAHIILYTGFTEETLKSFPFYKRLSKVVDGIVVGPFEQKKACMSEPRDFIGSTNQNYLAYSRFVFQRIPAIEANAYANDPTKWHRLGYRKTSLSSFFLPR